MKEERYVLKGSNLHGSELDIRVVVHERTSCHISVTHTNTSSLMSISPIFLAALILSFFLYTDSERITIALSGFSLFLPLIYYHYFDVYEEMFSVISGLGIIISTRYRTGRQTSKFIEESKVLDIIINEAITMYKVVFYMAVLVKTADTQQKSSEQTSMNYLESMQLVPLFMSSMPTITSLKEIYHTVQNIVHPT